MAARVLLTGATGLIGFRVLLTFLETGHTVRFTARSEEKLQKVFSNPAIGKLNPGDRLSGVVISDVTADAAFLVALQDITHIVHVGAPAPDPNIAEPMEQIYLPTVQGSRNILSAAKNTTSVKRVVITSSIVGQMPFPPDPDSIVTPSTRIQLPGSGSPPKTFQNNSQAYIMGKLHEMRNTETFIREEKPHFSVSYCFPGYVFGRNELVLNAEMARGMVSSSMLLLTGITGGDVPFPMHGGYAHIDDVADVHVKALFLNPPQTSSVTSFGICAPVEFNNAFGIVQNVFPKATTDGVFSQGQFLMLPLAYDSSETERTLGMKFKSFEDSFIDTAAQYLETLHRERA